jgi:hypothetical protein
MQKTGSQERFDEAFKHLLFGRPNEDLVFTSEEWAIFSAQLSCEGLLPYFYSNLKDRDAFPEQVVLESRQCYKNALLYKDYAVCRLKELQEQLCEKGRVVVIKGLALCEDVYREPEVRPMTDVDLYLPDGSIDDVKETLIDNNFTPVASYPYLLQTKELVMDLHQDLWGVRRIAERSTLIPVIEPKFVSSRLLPGYYIPSPFLLAIHTAYHGLKHGFSKKIWLLDLLKLYNSGNFDPKLIQTIGSMVVQVAFEHLHDQGLIADAIPEVRKITPLRQKLIKQALRHHNRTGIGEILMALCCETWPKTLVYFAATFFPKKQVLEEMYGKRPYVVLLLHRMVRMLIYACGMLVWQKK